jgi:hypothetical protein
MGKAYTVFRSRLPVAAVPVARLSYAPIEGCGYRAVITDPGRRYDDHGQELTVRPVRDRLLVTLAGGGQTSTALIGGDGRLFDFNLGGPGPPANAETWPALAKARAAALRSAGASDPHVLNHLAVLFPHYSVAMLNPGATVASVPDESGQPWARFVYRGTTSHQGRDGLLLDLVRGAGTGEQTVGFSLVDARAMIPQLLVLDSGYKIHFEQLRCR